jgi:tetratricopeptide (TPR) repeat protein
MASSTAAKRKSRPQASKAPASKTPRRAQDSAGFGPIAERFRRAGDLERAISLCQEGLQKFPHHISARVTLGWSLLDLGRYDEARTELEIVLRRAPDNLAAIRGLAELHDRSEHTLNLPMDGPGQWPPTADAVEGAGTIIGRDGKAIDTSADASDEVGDAAAAVMAPAEMGLAMWSAAPPDEPIMPNMVPVESHPSGMSSVRELDPNAGFVTMATPDISVEEPTLARKDALDRMAVSEADIAALIAEADSLEAAAEEIDSDEPELVLDAGMDLGDLNLDDVELGISRGPAAAPEVAEVAVAPQPAVETVPAVLIPSDEPERYAETSSVEEASVAVTPVATEPEPVEQLGVTVEVEPVEEPVAAAAVEVEPVEEPVAAAAVEVEPVEEPVAAAAVEVEPAEEPVAAAAVEVEPAEEPVAAAAVEVEPVEEPVEEPGIAAAVAIALVEQAPVLSEAAHAHVAEVVSMARAGTAGAGEPARSPVVALERFLARVQARRRQRVAESVA